jgi:hypothetical protein
VVVQDVETQFDPTYEGHFGVARHFRLGSTFPLTALTDPRLLLGVKQSKSAIKRTSSVTVGSLPICQENWVEVPDRPRCHVMKDLQIRIERL